MSKYLSWRRRLSEPEKPEPRFQWRMRVNSLMMDDSNENVSTRDALGSSGGFEASVTSHTSTRNIDTPLSFSQRERRERFARTKSESHIKHRVRFSRTLEEDADSSDASPELCRRRTLPSRNTTSREDLTYYSDRRYKTWRGHVDTKEDTQNQKFNSIEHGVSTRAASANSSTSKSAEMAIGGAIPKRERQELYKTSDSTSSDESDARSRRRGAKSSSPDSAIGDSLPNTQMVLRERSPSIESQKKTGNSHEKNETLAQNPVESTDDSASEADHLALEDTITPFSNVTPDAFSNPTCSVNNLPIQSKDFENDRSGEAVGTADDIESIIEQLIAEEQQGADSYVDSTLVTKVEGLMGPESRVYEEEMEQLQEAIYDCNRETSIAVELSLQEAKMSSSMPFVVLDEHRSSSTLIPCSSSYPPSRALYQKDNEDTAEEDEDASSETEEEMSSWANLPMILMEDVLTLLTPKERHLASQVCRQWYDLFYSPRVWETFILLERTLTKKRFNLYKGYQREICPGKTQLCFRRVGSFFKRIVVTPITDYFNLYEFLRILASFLQVREDSGESAMPLLHTFDFTFACATRGDGEIIIHGTGGQILEMIKELLTRMKGSLRHMKLNQLLLETSEVPSLFHALVRCFSECLHSLEMLNVTKVSFPLEELANFRNLVKLVVSPQHLNDESVLLLSGVGLLQLHIVQDPYTCECDAVSPEAWKLVCETAPWLRVYLEMTGNTKSQLLIQPRAPVFGIFLRSPHGALNHALLMTVVDNYAQTLRYFVQERLPRTHGPRGFEHRCDSALLFLVRRCSRLQTLVIRERISTATLLLLAYEGRGLSTLLVRQNALIKRCDWPQRGEFPVDFYKWLKESALDYQKCTDEICATLRRRWRPMSDRQFMRLNIVPRLEMF